MMTNFELRQKIDLELQRGSATVARGLLKDVWKSRPSAATAAFVLGWRDRLTKALPMPTCRLAILRSFTVEPVVSLLEASALLEGINLEVHMGGFNTYAQEMLDPSSALYAFQPDVVLLCVQTRDIAPELWEGGSLSPALSEMQGLIDEFRNRSKAHLIVHSFEQPAVAGQGILDGQLERGQRACIDQMNEGLREFARRSQSVYVLDYDALVGRVGRENWFDPLKWTTMRFPIAANCIQHLAKEWLRFVYALAGPVKKVLVTDLDNTLWGGLAGEEGTAGVLVGDTHQGIGYRNLQRAMLDLHRRGILLAVNSKNNEADALRILEDRDEMLLRPSHFAAIRINWQDKAQNLREIAEELNLGTDSLVFIDDNPVECARIRTELPEVEVIELPSDPGLYERALRDSVHFERLTITADDEARNQQYQDQRERQDLAKAATSLDDFYWSLRQTVTISAVQPDTLSRIAQLIRKTNQFNLTTRRYSEEQVREMAGAPDCDVYAVQVEDRFGDNGIVGVVITRTNERAVEIDTFLLSCRVIGRTVETAVLAHVAAESRRRDAQELHGVFLPSKKNAPAADFFERHNFAKADEADRWVLDLSNQTVECPSWIETRSASELIAHGN